MIEKEPSEEVPEIRSLKDLLEEFNKVFLIQDKGIIPLICATVIANQMDLDCIWMLLVSAPSSGKTELIESLELVNLKGKPLCWPISDLTINTFASGQTRAGKETSLLHKMGPGSLMTFKDFTSMISKNDDAQKAIMSQLREIYDKKYVKRTGTGKDITWQGKLGAIAGCTEAIYENNEQFAVMGDRFVMYKMEQPDRMEVLRYVVKASKDKTNTFESKKKYLKLCMKSYLEYCMENIEKVSLDMDPMTEDDLLRVVNFATMVSSGVMLDKRKGTVEFVPSHTMPMRMAKQLLALANGFILMNKLEPGSQKRGDLDSQQIKILYKVAFDTIPAKRRMALRILAKFSLGASTAGIATLLEYQTPVVAGWLAQLNALGIVKRSKEAGGHDKWFLKDEYLEIMQKFENIVPVEETLDAVDEEDFNEGWGEKNRQAKLYNPSKDDFEKSDDEIAVQTTMQQLRDEGHIK